MSPEMLTVSLLSPRGFYTKLMLRIADTPYQVLSQTGTMKPRSADDVVSSSVDLWWLHHQGVIKALQAAGPVLWAKSASDRCYKARLSAPKQLGLVISAHWRWHHLTSVRLTHLPLSGFISSSRPMLHLRGAHTGQRGLSATMAGAQLKSMRRRKWGNAVSVIIERCDASPHCISSTLTSPSRMLHDVSYIRPGRKEIHWTQRSIKLEESRVGTKIFHFRVEGCESGKVHLCLGHKTKIVLMAQHKMCSIIFSPQYFTGLESYDFLEVTV